MEGSFSDTIHLKVQKLIARIDTLVTSMRQMFETLNDVQYESREDWKSDHEL